MFMRSRLYTPSIVLALVLGSLSGCDDSPAGSETSPASTCERYAASLQSTLEAKVASLGIPGATASIEAPGCSWAGGAGHGNLETKAPMSGEDLLRIASITKTYTAALVMTLVEDGKLALDDDVASYIPDLPGGEDITIRQLLSHTSGLFNYVEDPDFYAQLAAEPTKVWAPEELVAQAMKQPPYFEPGTGWHYSNTGYVLLGMIVERATGSTYAAELESRILTPLGLEHTYLDPGDGTSPPIDGLIHGYSQAEDGSMADTTALYSVSTAWSAGALVASAADVTRFYQGLLAGDLLGPTELAAMTTYPATDAPFFQAIAPDCTGYGLGLVQCTREPFGTVEGHTGEIWGFTSMALHVPEHDLYMSAAINTNDAAGVEELLLAVGAVVLSEP